MTYFGQIKVALNFIGTTVFFHCLDKKGINYIIIDLFMQKTIFVKLDTENEENNFNIAEMIAFDILSTTQVQS